MKKLYVITRRDLPAGLAAAQACHAVARFCLESPVRARDWERECNLIVLAVDDEPALEQLRVQLEQQEAEPVTFHEPDLGGELTALACREDARPLLSSLPLALRAA